MRNRKKITGLIGIVIALFLVVLVSYSNSNVEDDISSKFFNVDMSKSNDEIIQELEEYAANNDISCFDTEVGVLLQDGKSIFAYRVDSEILTFNQETVKVKREIAESIKVGDSYSYCIKKLNQPSAMRRLRKSKNEFDANWYNTDTDDSFNLVIDFENNKVKSIEISQVQRKYVEGMKIIPWTKQK